MKKTIIYSLASIVAYWVTSKFKKRNVEDAEIEEHDVDIEVVEIGEPDSDLEDVEIAFTENEMI